MIRAAIAAPLLIALFACRGSSAPPEPAQAQLTFLETTTGGASARDALPMVVALHGLGDRPESFARVLSGLGAKARIIVPQPPITLEGGGFGWFSVRVRDNDPARLATGIASGAEKVAALIDALVESRPTIGRPLVIGFSQGAMVTFGLVERYGGKLEAAFAVAGLYPAEREGRGVAPRDAAELIVFHGEADTVVPFAAAMAAARDFEGRGYQVSVRRYPRLGHRFSPALLADLLAAVQSRLPTKN